MRKVFIGDWFATDVSVTPVSLRDTGEPELMKNVVDDDVKAPPDLKLDDIASLARAGYFLYNDQGNPFMEKSDFYFSQAKLSMNAVVCIKTARPVCLRGVIWVTGVADVWVNGIRQRRFVSASRMCPRPHEIRLDLREGVNAVFVREQNFGTTVARELIGIELENPPSGVETVLPGGAEFRAKVTEVRSWLKSITSTPEGRISAVSPPPCPVTLCTATGTAEHVVEKDHTLWSEGCAVAVIPPTADAIVAHADFMGQRLTRRFEHMENYKIPEPLGYGRAEIQNWQLRIIAANNSGSIRGVMPSMARRMLGIADENDDKIFLDALDDVDRHPDCADFYLAGMLRTALSLPLSDMVKERLREVSLRFRYWSDEDGADAMCFTTENHSLLFHACQLMAGKIYGGEVFKLSGRTGAEQVEIALVRCGEWADARIKSGFDEFLSSTYIPLTLAAMTLVYDFCGGAALREKYRKLCDAVFEQMALFSFDGVAVGPQGRVYRNILHPNESGAQAILCYVNPSALPCAGSWMTHFFASGYEAPEYIAGLDKKEQDTRITQAGVDIDLYRTEEYMLTSLALPSRADGYLPGQNGGQQHINHAALGRDCHVFINHAGCAPDFGHSRPGYWYGNGIMPAQRQVKNMLLTIYNIPEQYPFSVTHVFWPAHAFDESFTETHWAFGRRGGGYVAVWCSGALEPYSHTLQGKELRTGGALTAWMLYCSCKDECGSFEVFVRKARELNPEFNACEIRLCAGGAVLEY